MKPKLISNVKQNRTKTISINYDPSDIAMCALYLDCSKVKFNSMQDLLNKIISHYVKSIQGAYMGSHHPLGIQPMDPMEALKVLEKFGLGGLKSQRVGIKKINLRNFNEETEEAEEVEG